MTTKRIVLALGMSVIASALIGCVNDPANNGATFSDWMREDSSSRGAAGNPDPKLMPVTYYAAGKLFEKRGQYEQAAKKYHQAVAANRNFIVAYNRLGIVLDRLERYEAADDAFIRGIEIVPDKAYLRNNLAFSYILQRRYDDAEAELANALQLQPDFKRAHVNLGLVYARQKQFNPALQQFMQALPKADAYYNMGMIFASLKRYQDAADLYRLALEFQPQMTAARTQLDRLAHHLSDARFDEPQAIITADGIVSVRVDHKPIIPDVPRRPLAQSTESKPEITLDLTQSTAVAQATPFDTVQEADIVTPGSSDASEEMDSEEFFEEEEIIEDEEFVEDSDESSENQGNESVESATNDTSQIEMESAKGAITADGTAENQPGESGTRTASDPGSDPDAETVAEEKPQSVDPHEIAEADPADASDARQVNTTDQPTESAAHVADQEPIGGILLNFEHDRPDFVGLPPALQREIFQKLAAIARMNLGRAAQRIQAELDRIETTAGIVVLQFEHDRPDYTGPSRVDQQEQFVRNVLESVGIATDERDLADPNVQAIDRLTLDPARSDDPDWIDPLFPAGQTLDEE